MASPKSYSEKALYEVPAGLALIKAHKALEDLCLERGVKSYSEKALLRPTTVQDPLKNFSFTVPVTP